MLSDLQKRAAQAIVNVFETGSPRGDYGKVTLIAGDSGQLTYGRSQTTLASGNLHLLLKRYCVEGNAALGKPLSKYLTRTSKKDTSLNKDGGFRSLLEEAGYDPVMREVQDIFFDEVYWLPSIQKAEQEGVYNALGSGVVYDSCIHGSWPRIKDITNERHGKSASIGEQIWIEFYINERKEWLANHVNTLLRRTVYRMNSFQQLIVDEKWELQLPLSVRGVPIDEDVLRDTEPVRVSAEDVTDKTLLLITPRMRGNDVRALQIALSRDGIQIAADGIFGPATDRAVKAFQKKRGLRVDGVVGPVTRTALRL
jgi:chitosanase